jgi:O-methyltransferase involved in polyketide biosynthesis
MRIRHARTDRRRIAQTVELPSERASLRALDSPHARCALSATWLVEGLLQYLDAQVVDGLFAKIDALSALGSTLLYDVVGESAASAAARGDPALHARSRSAVDLRQR